MSATPGHHAACMALALAEARAAAQAGEVPVGALVILDDQVLAAGQNRVLRDTDPTAHAEIVALRTAARAVGNYRLTGCTLYTTLEPCAMCAGAVVHARIAHLVYGADDPKAGAVHSTMQVVNHPALNHSLAVTGGILGEEAAELLRAFFASRRGIRPPR